MNRKYPQCSRGPYVHMAGKLRGSGGVQCDSWPVENTMVFVLV